MTLFQLDIGACLGATTLFAPKNNIQLQLNATVLQSPSRHVPDNGHTSTRVVIRKAGLQAMLKKKQPFPQLPSVSDGWMDGMRED